MKSPFFDDVRNEECEVVAADKMVFPFEHETSIGDTLEKRKIRQLIYKEALQFKCTCSLWFMSSKNHKPPVRKAISVSSLTPAPRIPPAATYIVPNVPGVQPVPIGECRVNA